MDSMTALATVKGSLKFVFTTKEDMTMQQEILEVD